MAKSFWRSSADGVMKVVNKVADAKKSAERTLQSIGARHRVKHDQKQKDIDSGKIRLRS